MSKYFHNILFQEGGNAQEAEAQERQNQANEVKNSILSQILDQSARARCMYCQQTKI